MNSKTEQAHPTCQIGLIAVWWDILLSETWSLRHVIQRVGLLDGYNITYHWVDTQVCMYVLIFFIQQPKTFEPWHEISNNVVYATSKGSNQPAHKCSLIRASASRLSTLSLLSYWLNTICSF